jgi:hypothetical protein
MLAKTSDYHNHKETMAYAGVLAQVTVAGGVLSSPWPSEWVPPIHTACFSVSPIRLSIAGYIAIWTLINTFIRWQLRNRRYAATFVAALEETLRKWAGSEADAADLDPYRDTDPQPKRWLANFIDSYAFPWRSATLYSDVSQVGWPNALAVQWLEKARAYQRAPVPGEWLLSCGSILALAAALARLLCA